MRILLLGAGGREHGLARALAPDADLLIAPGNPGMEALGETIQVDITDGAAVAGLATERAADLVVVGPEAPLVAGVGDAVRAAGIPVFGPGQAAARLEGSKAFAKQVMAEAGVPTAQAAACTTMDDVAAALDRFGAPYVVKDDGLAAGKGVVVTASRDEALAHAERCLAARGAAGCVVIEEFLDGPEISLFCLCDGKRALPLTPAQDFKRALDGDRGPNTGGMGAYSPLPWAPADLADDVVQRVAQPVLDHLARAGTPFIGLLYCGLALTSRGLRVIEFNVRFGDPETQIILPLLRTRLAPVLLAAAHGDLGDHTLEWDEGAAVGIVLASEGYPDRPQTGRVITGVEEAGAQEGIHVIHAGTGRGPGGHLLATGGRVLTVVGQGSDLGQARSRALTAVRAIQLDGAHYRTDIAAKVSS